MWNSSLILMLACFTNHSQVFKKKSNSTKILLLQSTQHPPIWKNNYINGSTSPRKLQISDCRFDPATPPPALPQFSFLAAGLVGMFLKMWKMSSNPLHLPPVPPQLKNFAWVVLTITLSKFLIQLLIYLFFHIIKDENLFDFKSTEKKYLIGILQLTFFKKPAS